MNNVIMDAVEMFLRVFISFDVYGHANRSIIANAEHAIINANTVIVWLIESERIIQKVQLIETTSSFVTRSQK